eukprot:TRINITY_DN10125_c0_g1_i2.p1 TRINITY_DN10125_c0_g1~~TRINITY_DN10125_c0_g1_i2.p1  ORF type:complete len:368 (+),score=63.38 TRINITY_DN10125_c0_g1_i2:49-1152(+)
MIFALRAVLLLLFCIAADAGVMRRSGRQMEREVSYDGFVASPAENLTGVRTAGTCDHSSDTCLATDLRTTRESFFQCIASLGYGQSYRDNEVWEEYSPCEGQIDGHHMMLSEPQNAISSFAFDKISCISASSNQMKKSAALLGFGSFIFHAVGGAADMETPQLLDSLGMQCLAVNVLFSAMQKTSTNFQFEGYDFEHLDANCADWLANEGLKNCNDKQSNIDDLRAVKDKLPSYELSFALLAQGISKACGGELVPAVKNVLSDVVGNLLSNSVPSYVSNFEFRKWHDFNGAKVHRRRRRRQNMVQDAASVIDFCASSVPSFAEDFIAAVQRQGKFPSTKAEQHHTWHEKSASAMTTIVKGIDALRST